MCHQVWCDNNTSLVIVWCDKCQIKKVLCGCGRVFLSVKRGSRKNSIEKKERKKRGKLKPMAFCDTNALGYWTVCEHRPFGAHNLYPAGGIYLSVVFYRSVNGEWGNILQTWGVR